MSDEVLRDEPAAARVPGRLGPPRPGAAAPRRVRTVRAGGRAAARCSRLRLHSNRVRASGLVPMVPSKWMDFE